MISPPMKKRTITINPALLHARIINDLTAEEDVSVRSQASTSTTNQDVVQIVEEVSTPPGLMSSELAPEEFLNRALLTHSATFAPGRVCRGIIPKDPEFQQWLSTPKELWKIRSTDYMVHLWICGLYVQAFQRLDDFLCLKLGEPSDFYTSASETFDLNWRKGRGALRRYGIFSKRIKDVHKLEFSTPQAKMEAVEELSRNLEVGFRPDDLVEEIRQCYVKLTYSMICGGSHIYETENK